MAPTKADITDTIAMVNAHPISPVASKIDKNKIEKLLKLKTIKKQFTN